MNFIQNSILMIDIISFILPEIGSIPGLRHLEIFGELHKEFQATLCCNS
jgi:hypothetical protein